MSYSEQRAAFDKITTSALQKVAATITPNSDSKTRREIARIVSSTSAQIGKPAAPAGLNMTTVANMVEGEHYIFPKKFKGVKDAMLVQLQSFPESGKETSHYVLLWPDNKNRRTGYRYLDFVSQDNGSLKLLLLSPEYIPFRKKQATAEINKYGALIFALFAFIDYIHEGNNATSTIVFHAKQQLTFENSSMDY